MHRLAGGRHFYSADFRSRFPDLLCLTTIITFLHLVCAAWAAAEATLEAEERASYLHFGVDARDAWAKASRHRYWQRRRLA